MNKYRKIKVSVVLLIILGIAMIYIGAFYGPKIMLPPIITGVGFFVIAWALNTIRK
ncbi:MAG: hypothetical protein QNK20_06035 [Aureibaculum sp.]|nr:hypothetical protein [Aureibaculum sp.]